MFEISIASVKNVARGKINLSIVVALRYSPRIGSSRIKNKRANTQTIKIVVYFFFNDIFAFIVIYFFLLDITYISMMFQKVFY